LHKLLPPEIARTPQAKRLLDHGCITTMDIVQLIYRPDEPQGSLKDFEFSRPTMQPRWQQGLADARTTLQASPWLAPMTSELGVRVWLAKSRLTGTGPRFVKIGRAVRYPEAAVREFIKGRMRTSTSEA
jgi:hypothetical protein